MKKLIKYLLLTAILFQFSCSDFLEEEPYSFLSPENLFTNPDGAEIAIVGIYENISSSNPSLWGSFRRGMLIIANFGTDDFTAKNNTDHQVTDFDNYTVLPNERDLDETWKNFYSGINQATSAIEKLPQSPIDEGLKQQYLAEAKFLRGFYYFYMVRLFGGVPIRQTETASLDQTNTPRSSIEDVYNLIIKDLTEAAPYLPSKSETPEGRATQAAAFGFLSKIYLTLGSHGKYNSVDGYEWVNTNEAFTKAVNYGEQMLTLPGYPLTDNYSEIFDLENSDEVVFSAELYGASGINAEGGFLANLFAPQNKGNINSSRGGQARGVPSLDLYEKYDENDNRRDWNIVEYRYKGCKEFPHPGGLTIKEDLGNPRLWAYGGKFRKPCGYTGAHHSTSQDFPLLRVADVMLMVAEAEAELNDGKATLRAKELLQQLRNARFEGDAPEIPEGDFLDFIFDERSRELVYEGQRWFDLVRTNRLLDAVRNVTPIMGDPLGKNNIQKYHYLFPIPQYEIDNNSEITQADQNPGY